MGLPRTHPSYQHPSFADCSSIDGNHGVTPKGEPAGPSRLGFVLRPEFRLKYKHHPTLANVSSRSHSCVCTGMYCCIPAVATTLFLLLRCRWSHRTPSRVHRSHAPPFARPQRLPESPRLPNHVGSTSRDRERGEKEGSSPVPAESRRTYIR